MNFECCCFLLNWPINLLYESVFFYIRGNRVYFYTSSRFVVINLIKLESIYILTIFFLFWFQVRNRWAKRDYPTRQVKLLDDS